MVFFYKQISGDSGDKAFIIKWLHEYHAENRLEGDHVFASFAVNFYIVFALQIFGLEQEQELYHQRIIDTTSASFCVLEICGGSVDCNMPRISSGKELNLSIPDSSLSGYRR